MNDKIYVAKKVVVHNLKSLEYEEYLKKIILTTDAELIKDGVQTIDDDFLEWFVKNPSCENVEVIEKLKYFNLDELRERSIKRLPYIYSEKIGYKIFITKEEATIEEEYLKDELKKYDGIDVVVLNKPEEPKQKTLEEDKLRQLFKNRSNCYADSEDLIQAMDEDCFIKTIKEWQQERMYSEEDIINALHILEIKDNKDYSKIYDGMKKCFEVFKKNETNNL
jgi:hypothetical protein